MKKIERDIEQLTDVRELNRIGQKYAGSGNYTVAMKAWLRAAELGDRQCRPGITTIYFLGYGSIGNEDHCKAAELIRQWREEGDEEVEQMIELQIKIRSDLAFT